MERENDRKRQMVSLAGIFSAVRGRAGAAMRFIGLCLYTIVLQPIGIFVSGSFPLATLMSLAVYIFIEVLPLNDLYPEKMRFAVALGAVWLMGIATVIVFEFQNLDKTREFIEHYKDQGTVPERVEATLLSQWFLWWSGNATD